MSTLSEQVVGLADRMRDLKEANRHCLLALGSDVMPIARIEDRVRRGSARPFSELWDQARVDRTETRPLRPFFYADDDAGQSGLTRTGYHSLARLIAADFFRLIITADISQRIDIALIDAKVPRPDWDVFSNMLIEEELLREILNQPMPQVKIIRLYGDLNIKFAFTRAEIETAVQRMNTLLATRLAELTLVVGYNVDRDVWPFAKAGNPNSLYYVSNRVPGWNSPLNNTLTSRGSDLNVMTGASVTLDGFFEELARVLLGDVEAAGQTGVVADAPMAQARTEQPRESAGAFDVTVPRGGPSRPPVTLEDAPTDGATAVQEPYGTAEPLTVDVDPETSDIDRDFVIVAPTTLEIVYDETNVVAFNCRGSYTYPGVQRRTVNLRPDELNQMMFDMGKNIMAHYRLNDTEARNGWRRQAKSEGQRLFKELFQQNPELMQNYGAALRAAGYENLSLCFTTPRQYLSMPFELLHDGNQPLAVQHPLYRKVMGVAGAGAESIDDLLRALRASKDPLRVLLIASQIGSSIKVNSEVDALADKIRGIASRLKYQDPEIKIVKGEDAEIKAVKTLLLRCRYHLVHFAGHGAYDPRTGENSALLFLSHAANQGWDRLTASQLAMLLKGSETRLLFMNCCEGAASGNAYELVGQDYLGLLDAAAQSGVSAVLGYRWQVRDGSARLFAEAFYDSLFATRSPAVATLDARKQIYFNDPTDETYMAPILLMQGQ